MGFSPTNDLNLVEYRSIHIMAIGVRAVQHNHGFVGFGAGFHSILHGTNKGIKADDHILNIKNHHIQRIRLLSGRLVVFTVQRCNNDAVLGRVRC